MIIVLILISINKCIFASFADYTDEDAEKETQNMIQEHKENFDSSKSDNNFLENLTISGGTLSPNFDRQILEYSLKIENNTKEINIVANPEDKNATVKGDGKVKVGDSLECKIDVIAESGTTRTYIVKISEEDIKKLENNNSESELSENTTEMLYNNDIENSNNVEKNNEEQNLEKSSNQKKYIIIAVCIIILLIILKNIFKINHKKSKH